MDETVKVIHIIDGDTFVAESKEGGKEKFFRLADVRAPDQGEIGALEATEALEELIDGKNVVIEHKGSTPYGMAIVDVMTSDGTHVNSAVKSVKREKLLAAYQAKA